MLILDARSFMHLFLICWILSSSWLLATLGRIVRESLLTRTERCMRSPVSLIEEGYCFPSSCLVLTASISFVAATRGALSYPDIMWVLIDDVRFSNSPDCLASNFRGLPCINKINNRFYTNSRPIMRAITHLMLVKQHQRLYDSSNRLIIILHRGNINFCIRNIKPDRVIT